MVNRERVIVAPAIGMLIRNNILYMKKGSIPLEAALS